MSGGIKLVELLIDYGATVKCFDQSNRTALDLVKEADIENASKLSSISSYLTI